MGSQVELLHLLEGDVVQSVQESESVDWWLGGSDGGRRTLIRLREVCR